MSKSKQEIIDELSQLCTDMAEKFFQAIYRRPSKADQIPLSHLKVLMFLSKKESFKIKTSYKPQALYFYQKELI